MTSSPPARRGPKLGELLVSCQLITQHQLNEARRLQDQSGEKLGSVLVGMDYLTVDLLLESLGRQYSRPTVNLFSTDIPVETLRLIPLEKMKKYGALPLGVSSHRFRVAMVDPNDIAATRELQFILGISVEPLLAPSFQISAALTLLEKMEGKLQAPLLGTDLLKACARRTRVSEVRTARLEELLSRMLQEEASDLLLVAGAPPSIKKNNELVRLPGPFLTPQQVIDYARKLTTEDQLKRFSQDRELDFALTLPELGRFRVNIYRQRSSVSIAVRPIVEEIPSLKKLRLPGWLEEYALKTQGLILITGPNGHGKTTTMAAMVDIINSKSRKNVITIEDPIEYLHRHKSSNVNQREVGLDTESFHVGLRHVLREAPDVIVIGEMRDPESFAIALQAADTGHLVISCVHANNAVLAVNRIIDVFPPEQQRQIRVQMADNMQLIFNQRLVARKDGSGRVLAYEKLTNSYRVKNIIREGKEHQIRALLQQSMEDFRSLDVSLAELCYDGLITVEAALHYCQDESFFKELMRKGRGALSAKPADQTLSKPG
ncbi:hypothetical protein DESUT3_15080 [Desulfuromonas versatilis]|uniref:Bacterial type II secretion system protein E domain-containing protein n=1 Tax=Desulfuromonas versatilis TaxID=2802975 RepID=A0ABN6DX36_9BACT|nr:PilT/PilU family type 4a pilus ATPase [Desulfuromonas versatilis]BCR04439.1 hypothetical protein DESUT3_15080 [Desulfuromonas versatilis]